MLGTGEVCLSIAAPSNVSFGILPVLVIGGGSLVAINIPFLSLPEKTKEKQGACLLIFNKYPNCNNPVL